MIEARKEGQGEIVLFVITIKCADSNGRCHDYQRERVNIDDHFTPILFQVKRESFDKYTWHCHSR